VAECGIHGGFDARGNGTRAMTEPRSLDFSTFLQRIPKVDLHCHLVGTLRQQTLAELAQRYGLALPRPAHALYEFADFYDFLDVLRLAASALRTADDFARVTYEALEDGYRLGNLRHAELLFNPQYFYPYGVTYRTMVDGMREGLAAARSGFGVSALLVPSFDRIIAPEGAMQILDDILAYRPDEVIGIGLDGAERNGPPERFAEVYARAGRAGLKRTAHVCEDNQTLREAPPRHYAICRDVLGCDRLDHGYNLLADPAMVVRARDEGLFFNTCTVTSVTRNLAKRRASIAQMVALGLNVTVNTDDPVMFKTDIADCYQRLFAGQPQWGVAQARIFSLNGVAASWLDPAEKASLTETFKRELGGLEREVTGATGGVVN
jgi:adenosine deaminase